MKVFPGYVIVLMLSLVTTSPATSKNPDQDKRLAQTDLPAIVSPPISTVTPLTGTVSFTLTDLEQMAAQNNPTLLQANEAIKAARGRAKQAGLWPNPVVGFEGVEWPIGRNARYFNQRSEYFGFVEQTIVLGGKLKKSRRIYEKEALVGEIQANAQRLRVLNTIRSLFYQALGAQQKVELESQLVKIAEDATQTTSELFNVGQADRPDFLESEVETEQVRHDLVVAKNNLKQTWQALVRVIGSPDMPLTQLDGQLEDQIGVLDEEQALNRLLGQSPEIKSAEAQLERARAVLVRAKAEPIPDLFLRGAIGYSTEPLDTLSGDSKGRSGLEVAVQAGMDLPIWNRNQGGIAAARAQVAYAETDLNRIRLAIGARFSEAVQNYNNALDAVLRYRTLVLPKADEAFQLYLAQFKKMSAAYPQVLIAQRTMAQVRKQYIIAIVDFRKSSTELEGFLLTGGLDAPSLTLEGGSVQRVEMTGVRSGSQGSANLIDNVVSPQE